MSVVKQKKIITKWEDGWVSDDRKTGYVVITNFERQHHIGLNNLGQIEKITKGKEKWFISLNGFEFGTRKIHGLRQLRVIGIDIDQYKLGLTIEDVKKYIHQLVRENILPMPNLITTSRGVQIFYIIDGGAAPAVSFVVSHITDQFVLKLKKVGADSNAKDLSRVMRVPYSINERNGSVVIPEIWHNVTYTLDALMSYCKPLNKAGGYRGKKKRKDKDLIPKGNGGLAYFHRTNSARLHDLNMLLALRDYEIEGYRNVFLYVYSFHQALSCNNVNDLFYMVQKLEKLGLPEKEFNRTVKSAWNDARRFFEYFKANGYKVKYKHNDGIIKPYKTASLIEKFDITEAEQEEMNCLHQGEISKKIVKEKEKNKKQNHRRKKGIGSKNEYQKKRKQKVESVIQKVELLHKQGLKQTQIAEKVGLSKARISRIIKGFRTI